MHPTQGKKGLPAPKCIRQTFRGEDRVVGGLIIYGLFIVTMMQCVKRNMKRDMSHKEAELCHSSDERNGNQTKRSGFVLLTNPGEFTFKMPTDHFRPCLGGGFAPATRASGS